MWNRSQAYARQFLERHREPIVDEIDDWLRRSPLSKKIRTAIAFDRSHSDWIYDILGWPVRDAGKCICIYFDGLVKRDSIDEVAEATLA